MRKEVEKLRQNEVHAAPTPYAAHTPAAPDCSLALGQKALEEFLAVGTSPASAHISTVEPTSGCSAGSSAHPLPGGLPFGLADGSPARNGLPRGFRFAVFRPVLSADPSLTACPVFRRQRLLERLTGVFGMPAMMRRIMQVLPMMMHARRTTMMVVRQVVVLAAVRVPQQHVEVVCDRLSPMSMSV
jgi:hypothetical protein